MRLLTAILLAALLSSIPARAQSTRIACDMAPAATLDESFGAPAEIVERADDSGVSFCKWQGGDGLYVKLSSITAESQGIVGGTPLEYFTQNLANQVENLGAANVTAIEGPWQAAQIVDVTTEANPQQFYSITFLNKDDTVTVETYGMPKQTTITLAGAVAEAM